MSTRAMPRGVRALLLGLALVLSACSNVEPTPSNTISSAPASDTEAAASEQSEPWWAGRTWAGEIDVCVEATDDESGCQWLAGLLIHRRCELKMFQTFAAALAVGASFEVLYDDAVRQGECQEVRELPSANAVEGLG